MTNSTQEEHSQLHPQFRCTILCIEQLGGLCLRTNVDPRILLSSTFCNSLYKCAPRWECPMGDDSDAYSQTTPRDASALIVTRIG